MVSLFFKSLVITFFAVMPIGPMALLCIKTTLNEGLKKGLIVGSAIVIGDIIYTCIAGFGVSSVISFIESINFYLRFLGGIYLTYLGFKFFTSTIRINNLNQHKASKKSNLKIFIITLLLTLTNPLTIIEMISIFTSLNVASYSANISFTLAFILGVISGTFLWHLILILGSYFISLRLNPNLFEYINKLSGIIIAGFGIYTVTQVFYT
jgi:threonine/homoserine/homoserine lactone efflux protein